MAFSGGATEVPKKSMSRKNIARVLHDAAERRPTSCPNLSPNERSIPFRHHGIRIRFFGPSESFHVPFGAKPVPSPPGCHALGSTRFMIMLHQAVYDGAIEGRVRAILRLRRTLIRWGDEVAFAITPSGPRVSRWLTQGPRHSHRFVTEAWRS